MKVKFKGKSDPMGFVKGKVYLVEGEWRQYYYIEAGDGEVCLIDKELFDVLDEEDNR